MTTCKLWLGKWQNALADVGECDALISDPPYSERTHGAYRKMEELGRHAIGYAAWSADDVAAFVEHWSPRVRGWMVALTDHVLIPAWQTAFEAAGRYSFAPLACIEPGARVRLVGDGPAQWSVFAMVARPRTREAQKWGSLPGGYVVPASQGWRGAKDVEGRNGVMGAKPLWLMRAIVRDYSRRGDLIVDPCAGGATTLLAARLEGRSAIGAEMDPATHALALKRLARPFTPQLFADELRERASNDNATQADMFDAADGGGGKP